MSSDVGAVRFDTPIGRCGISWNSRGVTSVRLPGAAVPGASGPAGTAGPGPLPGTVQRAVQGIRALLSGEPVDLGFVELDDRGVPPFDRRVYELTRTVPPGRTITYGEVATRLGEPSAARAVGRALGRNPFAIVVPCHRVVAGGGLGGFSARGGAATKRRLLVIEGAPAAGPPTLFDAR